jgi:hypothetical protein
MRIVGPSAIGLALLGGIWVAGNLNSATAQVTSANESIVMMDNCLPGDPGWNPTGGCSQKENLGDVSFAEFGQLLGSPLITGLVGHPSWRNEPSHLEAKGVGRVRVVNKGGRAHTLTRVVNFGGGSVPGFNIGMTRASECPANPGLVRDAIPPGESATVTNLQPGLNKLQCCFHPWMRATVRVQ